MKTDPETEATAYLVGAGTLFIQACALFIGLLPCLLLLVPLLLPPLVLGLVIAPFYGVWRLGKWALAQRGRRGRAPLPTREHALSA